jgi:uncharacterized protein (TIGR02588 family)
MSPKKENSRTLPRTVAEWASLSVSLILLATVVGQTVWLWVSEPVGPAQFKIERGEARSEAGLTHLHIMVTNVGGTAAREIRVEGKLKANGQEERPTTTIDFLPIQAREEIVLIFRGDASGASIEVVSYQQP